MNSLFQSAQKNFSIGLEMELQLINPKTQDLMSGAKELIRHIRHSEHEHLIKPEITQSMIEINSSVHQSPDALYRELLDITARLKPLCKKLGVALCGGGTHPFQKWSARKIFPNSRFRQLSWQYGYLAKRFTVFSMHIHIGCKKADDAIYLTHSFARYIPQLIALSASSPFYQGILTGFNSTRVNVVNAFPLSGHIPFVKTWTEFQKYFNKMRKLNIIHSMKDFYWDIRPKPDLGTVELRICDMPLTVEKAVMLTAYIQTLAHYLLKKRPQPISIDLYTVYDYNRFQASRFGYEGDFINPFTLTHTSIYKDILETLLLLEPDAKACGNQKYIKQIKQLVQNKENDAKYLKNIFGKKPCLVNIVKTKCNLWKKSLDLKLF